MKTGENRKIVCTLDKIIHIFKLFFCKIIKITSLSIFVNKLPDFFHTNSHYFVIKSNLFRIRITKEKNSLSEKCRKLHIFERTEIYRSLLRKLVGC